MTARVLGFIVQCEVCPQQALLDGYMEGWLCPRCAEVASDVPVAEAPLWRVKDDPGFRYEMHVGGKVAGAPLAAVVFPDGRKFVGEYRMNVKADADPMKRALAAIGAAWAAADALLNPDAGFGDVDVDQAAPITLTPSVVPMAIPVRDPLAAAIRAESERNPHDPAVCAIVGGKRFHLRSWTEHRDSPMLEVEWRLPPETPPALADADDEAELPYKPPPFTVAACLFGCGRPVIAQGEWCGVYGCCAPTPPKCGNESSGGRACVEDHPHIGQSHRAADGWRWWRDGGRAFGPGSELEHDALREVQG